MEADNDYDKRVTCVKCDGSFEELDIDKFYLRKAVVNKMEPTEIPVMKNQQDTAIFFRVEPEVKQKLQEIARVERRSVASIILLLVDKKIAEMKKNAN